MISIVCKHFHSEGHYRASFIVVPVLCSTESRLFGNVRVADSDASFFLQCCYDSIYTRVYKEKITHKNVTASNSELM